MLVSSAAASSSSSSSHPHVSRMRDQVYLRVVFDFEYLNEEGKRVYMKENEVLLLINKTNGDWWQVIRRRGDRRPFYAPAKYVLELRPDEVETLRRRQQLLQHPPHPRDSSTPPSTAPAPAPSAKFRDPRSMSTFNPAAVVGPSPYQNAAAASAGHLAPGPAAAAKLFNNNNNGHGHKRSSSNANVSQPSSATNSNSPPGTAANSGGKRLSGPLAEHLLGNSRFQERYRSNSLDSVLVADMQQQRRKKGGADKANGNGSGGGNTNTSSSGSGHAPSNRHSAVDVGTLLKENYHPYPFQKTASTSAAVAAALLDAAQSRTLEKRPTFDSLDKRKSWSVEGNPLKTSPPSHNLVTKGRISSYQNTAGLVSFPASSNTSAAPPKQQTPVSPSAKSQSQLATAKTAAASLAKKEEARRKPVPLPRSKIPVPSSGAAAAAAAANAPAAAQSSYSQQTKQQRDEPKLENRVSLHTRFFSKRSKTDLGSDGLAAYKAKQRGRVSVGVAGPSGATKYPAPRVPTFNRPVPQRRPDVGTVMSRAGRGMPASSSSDAVSAMAAATAAEKRPAVKTTTAPPQLKPEIKEKPQFSTFRSSATSVNNPTTQPARTFVNAGVVAKQHIEPKSPFQPSSMIKKMASESDLRQSVIFREVEEEKEEEMEEDDESHDTADGLERLRETEKHSIESLDPISLRVKGMGEETLNRRRRHRRLLQQQQQEQQEEKGPAGLVAAAKAKNVSDSQVVVNARQSLTASKMSLEDLPPPPPSPPGVPKAPVVDMDDVAMSKTRRILRVDADEDADERVRPAAKSEPLVISTEPLNDHRHRQRQRGRRHARRALDSSPIATTSSSSPPPPPPPLSESAEAMSVEGSTSFDSTDDSLGTDRSFDDDDHDHECDHGTDMSSSMGTPDNFKQRQQQQQQQHDTQQHTRRRSRTNSPSTSTTSSSKSPPSPTPMGLTPIRQVIPDWDEYEDSSTLRKFYFNAVTKEKSWKPPRKPKGGEGCHSATTSPVPGEEEGEEDDDKEKVEEEEAASLPSAEPEPQESHMTLEVAADQAESREEGNKTTKSTADDDSHKVEVPSGYEYRLDSDSGQHFYVNMFTGVRWCSAADAEGKVYFYEENGNESCWALPNVSQSIQDRDGGQDDDDGRSAPKPSHRQIKRPLTLSTRRLADQAEKPAPEQTTTKTEMLERKFSSSALLTPVSTPTSPGFQIGNINLVVVKQGQLNKTKLMEHGKRQRKHWVGAHVVLTDTFLMFFKDSKSFGAMMEQQGGGSGTIIKPEHCLDLKGSSVDWCAGDKSKRSNVFEVSATLLGLTVLLQDDSLQTSAEWYQEIREVIEALGRRVGVEPQVVPLEEKRKAAGRRVSPPMLLTPSPVLSPAPESVENGNSANQPASSTLHLPHSSVSDRRKQNKVSRTKSLKMKILGSNEELLEGGAASAPIASDNLSPAGAGALSASGSSNTLASSSGKSNIREKLRKFFQRRPTMDDLFHKGIIKNEPVFGSTLRDLELTDKTDVPRFVRKCVQEIEKDELLRTDGVYRQSGNLSHVQKIRLQVDQGNLACLEAVEDVHVLTGALKLFFRELKEPLIPWECVDKLLKACQGQRPVLSRKQKVRLIKEALARMPGTHRATLTLLIRHLLKVTQLKEYNRMQIPNLAIVFGPTLMWPPPAAATASSASSARFAQQNLALDMMQQNMIVEALLNYAQHVL